MRRVSPTPLRADLFFGALDRTLSVTTAALGRELIIRSLSLKQALAICLTADHLNIPRQGDEEVRRIVLATWNGDCQRHPERHEGEGKSPVLPQGPDPKPLFSLSAPDFLATLPARPDPLVEGLKIQPGTCGLLVAEPGAGKSWTGDAMALDLAMGEDVWGHFPVNGAKGILLIHLEDGPGRVADRLMALAAGKGLDALPSKLRIRAGVPIRLDEDRYLTVLRREIEEHDIALVVVDPFAYTHGREENSAKEMAPLLFSVKRLAADIGAAILLVHHYNKPGKDRPASGGARIRGTTALWAWRDWALYLEVRSGERLATWENKDGEPLQFVLRRIEDEGGGVRIQSEERTGSTRDENAARVREAFRALGAGGKGVTAPELEQETGLSRNTVTAHMRKLAAGSGGAIEEAKITGGKGGQALGWRLREGGGE